MLFSVEIWEVLEPFPNFIFVSILSVKVKPDLLLLLFMLLTFIFVQYFPCVPEKSLKDEKKKTNSQSEGTQMIWSSIKNSNAN